jgi:hypothetical protein
LEVGLISLDSGAGEGVGGDEEVADAEFGGAFLEQHGFEGFGFGGKERFCEGAGGSLRPSGRRQAVGAAEPSGGGGQVGIGDALVLQDGREGSGLGGDESLRTSSLSPAVS